MSSIKVIVLVLVLSTSIFASKKPYVEGIVFNKIVKKYKKFAKKRFIKLQKILDKSQNFTDIEKLKIVNDFYNKVSYSSDQKVYNQSDYWATPNEFLGKDKGDCEDYVIAKYFALQYAGVDTKKLFFSYVKSERYKATHMVLTYFKTSHSEPLVLDNLNRKIFLASKRKDLTPIYNFNPLSLKKSHKKWDQLRYHMKIGKI
ncbi:transglutaminase-like cysteine peptidase [Sulfurimonas sp. SAG-AH-194-I05]|nr:transglutaminase-like cysteine peptidase [Sulfurimonas sp. SAG-AH-194-I05]MDF1874284.1 transglutaminase-like cysteine peptidase [Sulfurimonas sp. SAG-AH-194-I05]